MAKGVACASRENYSDTDVMNVLKNFKAVYKGEQKTEDTEVTFVTETEDNQTEESNKRSEKEKPSFVTLEKGSYPGYTKLIACDRAEELVKIASALNYGPVIRSSKAEKLLAHEFEFDDAIAVQCESWPDEALTWLTRKRRSGWPNESIVKECSQIPSYIVSKPHACNAEDKYEWRLSFARQEGVLFRKIPLEVKMVYILSKVLVKGLQIEESSLSTYQLKTMFLWHCEQKSAEEFQSKELEVNVQEFLLSITKSLQQHKIENYFIPANNMISHIAPDVVKDAKQKVEHILQNFLTLCASIETARTYPFSIQSIATALEDGTDSESILIQRIQSNFLHAIAEGILSSYLPLSNSLWMLTPYVTGLSFKNPTLQEEPIQCFHVMQLLQKHSSMVFDVYGLPFIKLAVLYFVLQAESSADFLPIFQKLLPRIFGSISDMEVSYSLADVFCLIGLKRDMIATTTCCYLIGEWVKQSKAGSDIMMHTWHRATTAMELIEGGKHSRMLLSRLNEMAILLDVVPSDIEVGMATTLRLKPGTSTIETLETFCSLRNDVSLEGTQKQLVYAIFLFVNAGEGSVPNEAESSFKASKDLFDSKTFLSAAATFSFVTSVLVYQKFSNGERDTIQKFLHLMQSSGRCSHIEELEKDIEDLLSTPELDPSKAFHFVLYYTRLCMVSTSVAFVLSVLDELVPPHINLGILSASGIELTSTLETELAIDCLETWVRRSIEAAGTVVQNKALPVKVYGKLGHLFHVKLESTNDKHLIRKYRNKASVFFQTALNEDVTDVSVIGDYLLFCKGDKEEFGRYSDIAGSVSEVNTVSTYFPSSIPALKHFPELQKEIETNGNIFLS